MELDLVLLDPHERVIKSLLLSPNDAERAGYLLFGTANIDQDPWSGGTRRRFISHSVELIEGPDLISSSPQHVTWQTDGFMQLLCDAVNDNWVPGIVHSHPSGVAQFSAQDDRNEAELAVTAFRKGATGFISVVISGSGDIAARLWVSPDEFRSIPRLLHVGPRLSLVNDTETEPDFLDRQIRLFGHRANRQIRQMRCGIVGGGGTGSATLPLLLRLGIRDALMIEKDIADTSNLNRLHGSRRSDVALQHSKLEIHQRTVGDADLGMNLQIVDGWAGDPATWEPLKACDVIFSCTDDHAGRLFLNRFSRYYGIPVIDIGLAMQRRENGDFDIFARVSTLVPGHACLLCGGYIDPQRAHEESLRRSDPESYARLKEEAYVLGEGDPSPAVVTFTTEAATMAVNEWLNGICGFTTDGQMLPTRIRRFHARDDRIPHTDPRTDCPACNHQATLGRGDVEPFIGRVA